MVFSFIVELLLFASLQFQISRTETVYKGDDDSMVRFVYTPAANASAGSSIHASPSESSLSASVFARLFRDSDDPPPAAAVYGQDEDEDDEGIEMQDDEVLGRRYHVRMNVV